MPEEEQSQGEEMYGVEDLNATRVGVERAHDIIVAGEIITYPFRPRHSTKMPFAHAVKFLKNKAFRVTDASGKVYEPIAEAKPEARASLSIADDEVIARLDELTVESLAIRANALDGGEGFKKSSRKADIMAFLIERARQSRDPSARRAPGRGGDDDGGADDMSDDEVAAMLGNEGEAA